MKMPFGRAAALKWWNRWSRLLGARECRTFFGAVMECDARDSIQGTIQHFGTWEPEVSRTFSRLVSPGDTVVDIGSNIGYYALLFAHLVGPGGKVVAVEPLPDLAVTIRRHAEINRYANVDVVNAAVSDRKGTVRMYRAGAGNVGMSTTRAERGFTDVGDVPALSILDLPVDLREVRLIKIDIEGAEVPVLRQLLANLDRFGRQLCVQVEASTTDNPEWPALFDAFVQAGFRAYEIPNRLVTLWGELLYRSPPKPATEVNALPPGEPDLLFTR